MPATAEQIACSHCGLPVPAGLVEEDVSEQFCCNGCRTVYAIIHSCGLERFYKVRDATSAEAAPAITTVRKYSDFDDQVFRTLYVQQLADGSETVELYLEGVHCAACVWLVEKLPTVVAGVLEARLDMRRAMVQVRWDPSRTHLAEISRMLDSLGYPAHPAKDLQSRRMRKSEDRRFLIRVGVAGACAGNVMTLSFALYGGQFSGIELPYLRLFRWTSMLFGLIALVWPGSLFFRGAWAALRTRSINLDLPIALGLAAGGIAGTVNAILDRGDIYFDSLSVLVLLLLIGRWLQRRQQHWANDSLELLFSLTPSTARRIEGDTIVEAPIEAVRAGDLVEVRGGDCIPADGVVLEGNSSVDRALLTGESQPAEVSPNSPVYAGTINIASRLVVRVESVGESSRVGRLMRLVEEYSRSRPPVVQAADRIAGRFVVVVLALAVLTVAFWAWREPAKAIDRAVALLIVTCPCGLGLATPLAMTIALGRAAQRHILVKGGTTLEVLAGRGILFLDKTGTLTAGRTTLVDWIGDRSLLPLVAALERHSAHPIAQAIVAAADAGDEGSNIVAENVAQTIGGGLIGTVQSHHLVVGTARFLNGQHVAIDGNMETAQAKVIADGATPVLVGVDGHCVAVASLGDPLRDDAADALDALRKRGWEPRILSGDHPDVVAAVADKLGIDRALALGGVSPEEKLQAVRKAARTAPVVMVGDGVNDAAALSTASVGIAVHGGAEASLAAAHVYLDKPGLQPLVALTQAAEKTMAAIHRCMAFSLCYNAITGSLAIAGWITPLAAAVLMPISSFTVLTLAYCVRTFPVSASQTRKPHPRKIDGNS